MESRAPKAYDLWHQASERYDYFVLGACVALTGYLGSEYQPAAIGWNPATLELGALCGFFLAGWAGTLRARAGEVFFRNQFSLIENRERITGLRVALQTFEGDDLSLNGLRLPRAMAPQLMQEAAQASLSIQALMDAEKPRMERWYKRRDALLLIGGLALVGAQVWKAVLASQ